MAKPRYTETLLRYEGHREDDGHAVVHVITRAGDDEYRNALPPRNNVLNHSPDGFEWGYSGSGPAQLSLAILCDFLKRAGEEDPNAIAVRLHQQFKRAFVANLDREDWAILADTVGAWLADARQTGGATGPTGPTGWRAGR